VLRSELYAVLRLAGSIVPAQMGMMGLGMADTVAAGTLGSEAIAAVGLAQAWRMTVLIVAQGAAAGIVPFIASAWSRHDYDNASQAFLHGGILLTFIGLPIIAWHWTAAAGLGFLGEPQSIVARSAEYCRILSCAVPGFLLFYALQSFSQGVGGAKNTIWAVLLGNAANALADWGLMYGLCGLPKLGLNGLAWSTVAVSYLMCGALFLSTLSLRRMLGVAHFDAFKFRRMLATALPIGVQWGLELWVFYAALLQAGRLGPAVLAAHVIVQNLASLVFMIPLGLGAAAAVRVAHCCGIGQSWVPSAQASVLLGVLATCVPAAVFILIPIRLGSVYTDASVVLALIASALPIAGVMQVFDGVQATVLGVLRGMGDTALPSFMNPAGLWLLGLPSAIVFSRVFGWGIAGLWLGLTVGVFVVAGMLLFRLSRHARGVQGASVQRRRNARGTPYITP
jgi:MATE family multidrug resistance protein